MILSIEMRLNSVDRQSVIYKNNPAFKIIF